jgi:hypothetical protein
VEPADASVTPTYFLAGYKCGHGLNLKYKIKKYFRLRTREDSEISGPYCARFNLLVSV